MNSRKVKFATGMVYASMVANMASVAMALDLPQTVKDAVSNIFTAIQIVGVIVAVIMISWAGFQFLTAGAGKKAEAKEKLVPIVVGALLIVLASSIARWIWNSVFNSSVEVSIVRS